MQKQSNRKKKNKKSVIDIKGITKITVSGYKSIAQEQSIEIRPLTILAGANSSGKSSIMQPLLLLKQTIDSPYDPGSLLLNGPNVRFTSGDQLLSRIGKKQTVNSFYVGIKSGLYDSVTFHFKKQPNKELKIDKMTYIDKDEKAIIYRKMSHKDIESVIPIDLRPLYEMISKDSKKKAELIVTRNRFFLELGITQRTGKERRNIITISLAGKIEPYIRNLIHLPGLRGNPARTYPVTAVESSFPGIFQTYAASVIAQWQRDKNINKLKKISNYLQKLGLTWRVTTKSISDTEVELRVGRLSDISEGKSRDLISIADIGFGVSQTLPILISLVAAEPGQLVYIEQPEIHLHPRAQIALAEVLADTANRGVRVVAETHSGLLLLSIQALLAEGKISPENVKLHWFERHDPNGYTNITSADIDKSGTFGDWPEDFGQVDLEVQSRYLDAFESFHN
ncbi:MAG: AAA family ATPase [Nitrosopumilus sp.]